MKEIKVVWTGKDRLFSVYQKLQEKGIDVKEMIDEAVLDLITRLYTDMGYIQYSIKQQKEKNLVE